MGNLNKDGVVNRKELLENLQKEIPFQWRVQSFSKNKPLAQCVAYIDARDVQKILDEHCTEGWQKDYKELKGNLYCGVGIKINGEWEWKWDCGTESSTEKEKGEASDSFKRAAVCWGVGRFLYDKDIIYVPASEIKDAKNYPYVVDKQGKRVWDITKHINEFYYKAPKKEANPAPQQPPVIPPNPPKIKNKVEDKGKVENEDPNKKEGLESDPGADFDQEMKMDVIRDEYLDLADEMGINSIEARAKAKDYFKVDKFEDVSEVQLENFIKAMREKKEKKEEEIDPEVLELVKKIKEALAIRTITSMMMLPKNKKHEDHPLVLKALKEKGVSK